MMTGTEVWVLLKLQESKFKRAGDNESSLAFIISILFFNNLDSTRMTHRRNKWSLFLPPAMETVQKYHTDIVPEAHEVSGVEDE